MTDPDHTRLCVTCAWLRPDCPDPLEPPRAEQVTCYAPVPRDPTASWGGLPSGFGQRGRHGSQDALLGTLADRLALVDALPAPAPAVLRWLRLHARPAAGVRAVAVELALHMGFALPERLDQRRDAAYLVGRRAMWGAVVELERAQRGRVAA